MCVVFVDAKLQNVIVQVAQNVVFVVVVTQEHDVVDAFAEIVASAAFENVGCLTQIQVFPNQYLRLAPFWLCERQQQQERAASTDDEKALKNACAAYQHDLVRQVSA